MSDDKSKSSSAKNNGFKKKKEDSIKNAVDPLVPELRDSENTDNETVEVDKKALLKLLKIMDTLQPLISECGDLKNELMKKSNLQEEDLIMLALSTSRPLRKEEPSTSKERSFQSKETEIVTTQGETSSVVKLSSPPVLMTNPMVSLEAQSTSQQGLNEIKKNVITQTENNRPNSQQISDQFSNPTSSNEFYSLPSDMHLSEISKLKNIIKFLQEEIKKLTQINKDWQKYNNQREVEFSLKQAKFDELTQQVNEITSGELSFTQRQQDFLNEEIQNVRSECDLEKEELQNRIDDLLQQLELKVQELESFKVNTAKTIENLSFLSEENEELKTQSVELSSALVVASRSNTNRNKKLEALEQKIRALQERLAQSNHDNQSLKAQVQHNQHEVDRLRRRQAEQQTYSLPPSRNLGAPNQAQRAPSYTPPPNQLFFSTPELNDQIMSQSLNFGPPSTIGSQNFSSLGPNINNMGFLGNQSYTPPSNQIYRPPSTHSNQIVGPPSLQSTYSNQTFGPPSLQSTHSNQTFGPPSVQSNHSNQTFGPPSVQSNHSNQSFGPPSNIMSPSNEMDDDDDAMYLNDIQTDGPLKMIC